MQVDSFHHNCTIYSTIQHCSSLAKNQAICQTTIGQYNISSCNCVKNSTRNMSGAPQISQIVDSNKYHI